MNQWRSYLARLSHFSANAFGRRELILTLLSIVIGIVVAYAAIGFRHALGLVQLGFFGTSSEHLYTHALGLPWWQILLAPAGGGLLIGLLVRYGLKSNRVHSVSDVIEANALYDGRIPVRDGLLSAVASAASLGMGASAGREGPAIHLGATLTAILARLFRLPPQLGRTLLACGVAAAVSASFNAPIAGVFFALEVVLGHYALHAFAPVVLSSVAAMAVSRAYFGDFPAFVIPDYGVASFFEYPAFFFLGIVCAMVAVVFLRGTAIASDAVDRTNVPIWMRPALGGLVIGGIAVFFPQILGVGYEATDTALKEGFALRILIALVIAKIAATIVTMACRFGGGVFSPALFLGAMTGGAYGIIATGIFPDYSGTYGLYAIAGMGGVAASVLGAPISTILIVFELTNDYQVTIVVMLATATASLITQRVSKSSFFYWQLERRGLHLKGGRARHLLQLRTIADFVSDRFRTIAPDAGLNRMRGMMEFADVDALVIIDDQGRPLGTVGPKDLQFGSTNREFDQLVRAGDFIGERLETVRPTTSLEAALAMFERTGLEYLPVLETVEGKDNVTGVISHKDVLVAQSRALWDARAEESGTY